MQYENRSFKIDVLRCPRCQGRLRILAAIHPPEATRKILDWLGLPSRPSSGARSPCSYDLARMGLKTRLRTAPKAPRRIRVPSILSYPAFPLLLERISPICPRRSLQTAILNSPNRSKTRILSWPPPHLFRLCASTGPRESISVSFWSAQTSWSISSTGRKKCSPRCNAPR